MLDAYWGAVKYIPVSLWPNEGNERIYILTPIITAKKFSLKRIQERLFDLLPASDEFRLIHHFPA